MPRHSPANARDFLLCRQCDAGDTPAHHACQTLPRRCLSVSDEEEDGESAIRSGRNAMRMREDERRRIRKKEKEKRERRRGKIGRIVRKNDAIFKEVELNARKAIE